MYTSKRQGDVSALDNQYLVGTPHRVQHFTEQHRLGLFSREDHLTPMRDTGLEVDSDPKGLLNRRLYVGRAPAGGSTGVSRRLPPTTDVAAGAASRVP